mgnify:CR=1 FL=1
MKKRFSFLSLFIILMACSGSDDGIRNNPNLANLNFRIQLNLNLPEYNNLQFAGNSFTTFNNGLKGIVIYNINNTQYAAFELSDPNHPPNSCSAMSVSGVIATCACENNKYNIATGQQTEGAGQYTMKPYRIEKIGNILEISN